MKDGILSPPIPPLTLKSNPWQRGDWIFLGIFAIAGLIGILNHAMWRDEINGWLIARDSVSASQFIHNIKYEGHPLLWYVFLSILNKITPNPVAMQVFHGIIGLGIAALWMRYAPFLAWQRRLWLLGYLPFYEYLLISRNYSIGLLALIGFCAIFASRKTTYVYLALMLAFMANTNAYGLIIAINLSFLLIIDRLWLARTLTILTESSATQNPYRDKLAKRLQRNEWISLVIVGISFLLSIWTLLPPADSQLQGGGSQWFLSFDLHRIFQSISRIWNSYILILVPKDASLLDTGLFAVLSLGLGLFAIALLSDRPLVLLFYLLSTGSLLSFTYLKFLGSQRHYGHVYLILIAALWLRIYYPKSALLTTQIQRIPQFWARAINRWIRFAQQQQNKFIGLILLCQLIAGLVSFSRDLTIPYSASRATADYLQQEKLSNKLIVGSEDFAVSPLSGYLQKQIYYPETQKMGSYVLFNSKRKTVNDQQILEQTSNLLTSHPQGIILLLNHPLTTHSDRLKIAPLSAFKRSFIYNESYILYEVQLNTELKKS